MMERFVRVFALVVLTTESTNSFEKYWLPDLEWKTPSNWLNDRLPEIDSHVVFPLETRHTVGTPRSMDLKLSSIDLARTGALLLPREGKLEISGSRKSTVRWSKEGHFFWADPENWNGSSIAAPHLERVPCRRDDIVLPGTERALSVLMPMKEINVRSVRMSDRKQPFTRWQWDEMKDKRDFGRGRFTVTYSKYSCDKCPCQDDPNGDYLEEICGIQRTRCGSWSCEYPLSVEGHCCRYCGGRVSLTSSASLSIVRMVAGEAMEDYQRLDYHVRRTWTGGAEVLVKEKGDYSGLDVDEAVQNLKNMLKNAGIEVLATETAGAALRESRLAVTLGPFLGAPLILLALLLLGFSYFGYTFGHVLSSCGEAFNSVRDGIRSEKPQSGKPFGFARFENASEGNVEIADVPSTGEQKLENEQEEERAGSSGGRFENPLYRSKRRREDERKIIDMEAPLSLSTLKDKVEERLEEVEMNIDE